jgi:S-formylglutathione hydrolase FrmB
MHPELFGTFEDIAGDLGPNVGNRAKTIATLYGGDATAWTRFDPVTVLAAHSRYPDSAGWFVNSTGNGGYRAGPRPGGAGGGAHPGRRGRPGAGSDLAGYGGRPDGGESPAAEVDAATTLCAAASARGIQCTQHVLSGRHSWQFASSAFGQALPWLAQRLGAIATGGAAEGATAAVSAMPAR